ncbi:hypothetical protein T492DRAFT_1052463 [Pavlovales sp. CCMP2436]|nr:hypothetical protein T492DRAFT_1052463 [Pavlovales sp. CCMP2436]
MSRGARSALLLLAAVLALGTDALCASSCAPGRSRSALAPARRVARGKVGSHRMAEAMDFSFLTGAGLGVADDGSKLATGDRVRVVANGLQFFHVPGNPKLDPVGKEGEVVKVYDGPVSANLPVVVVFEEPRKFRAHFEAHELERL